MAGGAVAQWLACCTGDALKATIGLSPGQDRSNAHFSVLPSQRLCRIVIACLASVCTAHTTIVAHIKDHMSTFC